MNNAYATRVAVTVNGEPRVVTVDNRMSVLDLLRERLTPSWPPSPPAPSAARLRWR
jgi:hypothetical protein